jgi:hypothetical protein
MNFRMSRMASILDLELLEEEMREGNGDGVEIKLKNMMQGPCEMYVAEMQNPMGKLMAAAPVYVGQNIAGMGAVVRMKARLRQDQAQMVSDFILMHTSSWLFHLHEHDPSQHIKFLFVSPTNPFTFKMIDTCLKKQAFEYDDKIKMQKTAIAKTEDGYFVSAERLMVGEKTMVMYITHHKHNDENNGGDWNACTGSSSSGGADDKKLRCTINAFIADLNGQRNLLISNKPLSPPDTTTTTAETRRVSFNNSKVLVITNPNPEIPLMFPEEEEAKNKDNSSTPLDIVTSFEMTL